MGRRQPGLDAIENGSRQAARVEDEEGINSPNGGTSGGGGDKDGKNRTSPTSVMDTPAGGGMSEKVGTRSDVNILLCGDPGTSKSQLLSYVRRHPVLSYSYSYFATISLSSSPLL